MSKEKENKIPILSFYSGGGFLDMGFEKAGFEIVWTNENDETFAKLHAAGITSWRKSKGNGIKAEIFNTKSIVDVKVPEMIKEAFPNGKPEHFGIIGGPPCQDFSLNGSQMGFEGDRGKLTILFFDKILDARPTFFVMENVTGLIRVKSHKEHLVKLFKKIRKEYYLDHETLNALDYGVPQFRERVFFVGIRKDAIEETDMTFDLSMRWFNWPINKKYNGAFKKYEWPSAVEFGKRLSKPQDIPLELCVENCLVSHFDMKTIPNATEYFNLYVTENKLGKIDEGETNRPSFKRLHRFKFSPTACYGNNEVHLHPYKHRRISVREALRIQGVPDEYILPADLPLTKKFKMIGNGVPVPLAEAVANAVKHYVETNVIKNSSKVHGQLFTK
jgi:DNA (cytosine-5)-methyltransferase 1